MIENTFFAATISAAVLSVPVFAGDGGAVATQLHEKVRQSRLPNLTPFLPPCRRE